MSKILIIEDHKEVRFLLEKLLDMEGYDVISAAEGSEGLQELLRNRPDLVILDLMMQGMNGWDFLTYKNSDSTMSSIPVIVVSAVNNQSEMDGVFTIIKKPIDLDSFLDNVSKAINMSPTTKDSLNVAKSNFSARN